MTPRDQSELATRLGEGARAAVEVLLDEARATTDDPQQLLASVRADVMHAIAGSFAEARGMGPPTLIMKQLAGQLGPLAPERRARVLDCLPPPPALAHLPCECLGMVYEQLLDDELTADEHGQLRLHRRGDARKEAGSFYSPELLTTPTVERTLAPLLRDEDGRLHPPERLLALRLCDPAMGSGSFLLACLRSLAATIIESAHAHGQAHAWPAPRVHAAVLTQCLHGVDLDPLAAVLARVALWIEAGDARLSLAALADKLRCGDALVGASRTRLETYPIAATTRVAKHPTLKRLRKLAATQPLHWSARPPTRADFDAWSALWFWPLDQIEHCPAPAQCSDLPAPARTIIESVRAQRRFVHWELDFPEVFDRAAPGFDALIGNPPWEIQKPNSKAFFSRHDPHYRGYAKQQALRAQQALFEATPQLAAEWRAHTQAHEDFANFSKHVFQHQGAADLNSYKLFIELALALLRPGGQLGLIVPSGIYTDKGCQALRELLLQDCEWRWLYGFENRAKLFAIDGRFKFCVLIAGKGGHTRAIQTAFMRQELRDWAERVAVVEYPAARVHELSPDSASLLELRSEQDLAVLSTLHDGAVRLGAQTPDSWQIRCTTELHMTADSRLFVGRERAQARGFAPDEHGMWHDPAANTLLPLYEGRMIGQFDHAEKGWERGKGRSAIWRELDWADKRIEPQWLIAAEDWQRTLAAIDEPRPSGPKLVYMAIGSASNRRSMFAALVPDYPCGNALTILRPGGAREGDLHSLLAIAATLNSFAYDFALRARLGGLNLNHFIMRETPLIRPAAVPPALARVAARLSLGAPCFAASREALKLGDADVALRVHERLRLRCMLDAMIAALYGLRREQFAWILSDCDHPVARLREQGFCRQLDAKGFWRIDKSAPPELRHSVLSLRAFDDLHEHIAAAGSRGAGIQRFCEQHDGAGWMLPEHLCVAELGLRRSVDIGDYDARARTPQGVRADLERAGVC